MRLIDLGLAQLNSQIEQEDVQGDHFRGNILFASLNQVLYRRYGTREDLESLIYILYYLMNDLTLPWKGVIL